MEIINKFINEIFYYYMQTHLCRETTIPLMISLEKPGQSLLFYLTTIIFIGVGTKWRRWSQNVIVSWPNSIKHDFYRRRYS